MSDENKYTADDVFLMFLEWRGIDIAMNKPCDKCDGSGVRSYASTSTWRGGIGGMMVTLDVCDFCWGSGVKEKPWPSWRKLLTRTVDNRSVDSCPR